MDANDLPLRREDGQGARLQESSAIPGEVLLGASEPTINNWVGIWSREAFEVYINQIKASALRDYVASSCSGEEDLDLHQLTCVPLLEAAEQLEAGNPLPIREDDSVSLSEKILVELRELHHPSGIRLPYCSECDKRWPCPSALIMGAGSVVDD